MSRHSACTLVLLAALAMPVAGVVAQESKKTQPELAPIKAPVTPKVQLEEKDEQKSSAFSPGHEVLEMMAGRFRAEARIYPAPGAEPIESRGMAISEMIMGGRFLETRYKGDMQGTSFEGLAIDGYDQATDKHQSIWLDSQGTAISMFEGTADYSGKVLTLYSESVDPESGKKKITKGVTSVRSFSLYTYEAWEKVGDGEFVKTMEVRYTRM